jgi:glycosyltransferase involved in cell wall biosynthesis
MNIVCTSLMDLEHDTNGVISVARDLNRLLECAGHTVRHVTPANNQEQSILRAMLRRLHRITGSPLAFLAVMRYNLKRMTAQMSEVGRCPDAIIAHDALSAGAALEAVKGRCPVLLFCHFGHKPWDEFADAGLVRSGSPAYKIVRRWMQGALHSPDVTLLAVSERNAALLQQMIPDEIERRIHVVYPGIEASAGQSRPKLSRQQRPTIVNVGRIERLKNQRIIPEIACELKQHHKFSGNFILIGPNHDEEAAYIAARIAELDVGDMVTLTGPLERCDVLRAMAKADLYLHTSLVESFGMTLVEAMACGTPVMALEYEALHEILTDTPEMIIPADTIAADIAVKLAELLTDRQRLASVQMRQQAVFEQRFSPEAFLTGVLGVLDAARQRRG